MEYVVVWASHPSWLTLQLPKDVAELIGYRPDEGSVRDGSRSISFLARGPKVARVVATRTVREALAVETVRGRLIASARPGDRPIFTLPHALTEYLGMRLQRRGPPNGWSTDDGLVWFAPAPEYYEYRSIAADGEPYIRPSSGPWGHVYVTTALYPFPAGLDGVAALEERIEQEEWRTAVRLLQRVGRGRREGAP